MTPEQFSLLIGHITICTFCIMSNTLWAHDAPERWRTRTRYVFNATIVLLVIAWHYIR